MLQIHLSDQQFYCLIRCVSYYRFNGTSYFHSFTYTRPVKFDKLPLILCPNKVQLFKQNILGNPIDKKSSCDRRYLTTLITSTDFYPFINKWVEMLWFLLTISNARQINSSRPGDIHNISKLVIMGWYYGLLPDWHQAIIWLNARSCQSHPWEQTSVKYDLKCKIFH